VQPGGIVGALIDAGEAENYANVYSEAVRRGGTLVSVRTDETRAAEEKQRRLSYWDEGGEALRFRLLPCFRGAFWWFACNFPRYLGGAPQVNPMK
jgi:hypothetical protein